MKHLTSLTLALVAAVTLSDAALADPGTAYTYTRSNSDGSNAETVEVYHARTGRVEVMKHRGQCTGAALVTAEIDPQTRSAEAIVGGRLMPDAQVMEFAFLNRNPDTGQMQAEIRLPDQTLAFESTVSDTRWVLYDFDFSALTVTSFEDISARNDFSFGVALLWADPGAPAMTYMGTANAIHAGDERRADTQTVRYDITGSAFDPTGGGTLWFDDEGGHLVEARFGAPSHPGYADFRLTFEGSQHLDADAWRDRLTAHFQGCE